MYLWVYKRKTPARRELDPKKENRMYTWVYKRKTPTRRELDPKSKQIECIHGYTSEIHLQERSQSKLTSKYNVYVGIEA